ncbi:NlpC/P60 family protein [Kutzneria chonburiensis]|uniref:NlpC/P60 family protein n=1 Tax=Kutzneria chonburiensis TaxID=1483604 RepID=A0ABV6MJ06_9PSEU
MHELSSGTPAGGNGAPLLSGDLVFFDSEESNIVHVGIAISSTRMINAPNEALRRASTALVNWELGGSTSWVRQPFKTLRPVGPEIFVQKERQIVAIDALESIIGIG